LLALLFLRSTLSRKLLLALPLLFGGPLLLKLLQAILTVLVGFLLCAISAVLIGQLG
jgi:hypothetical protein